MRRRTLFVTAMVAAFIALGLLSAGCGGGEETPPSEQAATETPAAETGSETETAEASTGTAVGQFPPDFALPDLDDQTVTLSDFEGHVVIIDLWATWCPPCREEIPFLVDLYEEHKDDGLVVVGIGLDRTGVEALAPFAAEYDISYPILVGDRAVSRAYGASSIPTTYIIGRDGRIAARHVGFHPSMAPEMRETVEGLLEPEEV